MHEHDHGELFAPRQIEIDSLQAVAAIRHVQDLANRARAWRAVTRAMMADLGEELRRPAPLPSRVRHYGPRRILRAKNCWHPAYEEQNCRDDPAERD
jgi:hypothetical protein